MRILKQANTMRCRSGEKKKKKKKKKNNNNNNEK